MTTADSRLREAIDALFLTGVVFALFLAGKIVPALILFGVVPVPFLLRSLKERPLHVSPYRLAIPFVAYFGYSLVVYFFFTGLEPGERRPINPDLELYGIAILMLVLGCIRGLQIDDLAGKFRRVVPHALSASFFVLSMLMLFGYTDSCRVYGAAPWPFIPAVIFTTLTFLSLLSWNSMTLGQRRYRLALIAADVTVVLLYTGSRGVAVSLGFVLLSLGLLGLFRPFRGNLPNWRELSVSIVAGLMLCGAVGFATGCDVPLKRLVNIAHTAVILSNEERSAAQPPVAPAAQAPAAETPNVATPTPSTDASAEAPLSASPAPSATAAAPTQPEQKSILQTDVSIGLRLEMWSTSVKAIREAPFFGHGSLYLQHLIGEKYGYEHNHNQYLSWLVTGGILLLGLGLWLLATPWMLSSGLPITDRFVIALSITMVWGISMMFDSFLNMKFYLHYYCLLIGLIYALINDMLAKNSRRKGQS